LNLDFVKLTEPTAEIAASLSKWENDPALVHLIHPNSNAAALLNRTTITMENLKQRLESHHIYLIYLEGQLIGEMSYKIDPAYLYKRETGTAWIGITIGEEVGRGKGIGFHALQYLEAEIEQQGLKRIELGVFEFNQFAIKLYKKLGYKEIGRIEGFTYWQDKMWQDIRMDKYL